MAVSFLPFLLWMIVAVWLACFWFLIDAKARAEIYDGYALLYLGSKVIRIENSADINYTLHGKSVAYEIRNKDKIYYLTESLQELYEKKSAKDKDSPKIPSSLNEAMDEIICAVY
ncbi:MAG: hypothetical protein Q4D84_06010 [Campylobacter sp.]|nr:hypothetical protein [Campylobacter sp.]